MADFEQPGRMRAVASRPLECAADEFCFEGLTCAFEREIFVIADLVGLSVFVRVCR